MLSKNASELNWKKVSDGVQVAYFTSRAHSQKIYLKKIEAKKKLAKPVTIFLFHDLTSYHGRFLKMTSWFQARHPEISFIMMDFCGHGLSSGTRGHITKFTDLVDDVADVFDLIEKKPEDHWVALGHGLGAITILDLLNRFDGLINEKIDRIILSNFFLNFSSILLQLQNKIFENLPFIAQALQTLRTVEIYLPGEVLSGPHEQAIYLEDPLIVRRPTYETLKVVSTKVKGIYQDSYFLDKPTLILKSQSPYLLNRAMESFGKGLKKGLLTEKNYLNLKHDLYNERENTLVFNDIIEWIQS